MYDWYQIFNLTEFEATGLVSRTYSLLFSDIGLQSVLVTKGNEVGITYDDTFLIVGFDSKNPYVRDGYAVFKDADENVWLGIEVGS